MTHNIVVLLLLALAVATSSITIAHSWLFKGFRVWISGYGESLEELVDCPYCISHWLSFLVVGLYRPRLINSGVLVLDLFIEALAVVAVSTLVAGLILRAYRIGVNHR